MTSSRESQVSLEATPYYHCISRCVRRAFLCGYDAYASKNFDHRKGWLLERLKQLTGVFAVDLCAYAVMSNHVHLVVHVDRERALSWSEDEVVRRYGKLFRNAKAQLEALTDEARLERVELYRARLYDLSWFMRSLNEHMARRANREDGCRGRFWEGRFKSQPLLDEAAL
ncbi:MAG: transposase, partial [Sandaracinaceae bacterium]